MKLDKLSQAIVVAHVMRRILGTYSHSERVKPIEEVMSRTKKFLLIRERKNKKIFIFATEFERVLWQNVTDKYDKKTKILALDFTSMVYDYFPEIMSKHANINQKLMDKISVLAGMVEVEKDDLRDMESNDKDLLTTFITQFQEHSGVGMRKSLFQGKKLIIAGNLICEGKTLKAGF